MCDLNRYTPGFDFAGVVESAGDGTELEVGEKVIGYIGLTETCSPDGPPSNGHGSAGAFAQYVSYLLSLSLFSLSLSHIRSKK